MPRGIKGSGKKSQPVKSTRRGRARKPQEAVANGRKRSKGNKAKELDLVGAEAELSRKYPEQQFKPGSLLPAGEHPDFHGKRSVIIHCRDCGAERRIATSDAFHTSRCEPCSKKVKREPQKS